jgi:ubiquinone/menaquinone biosynthesis C-methylase UbiE
MSDAQPYAGCPIEHGYSGVAKRLALMRQFADWRGKRVLDVGCGTGAYTLEIAREAERVWGIDITQRFLCAFQSHLAGAPPVHLARSASEQLPFADASFDVIVCIETLEHVTDEQATLQAMRRVLRPDGVLLLAIPNKRYPLETHGLRNMRHGHLIPFASWLPKNIHAKLASARIYTEKDIHALLGQTGWAITGMDWLLPPLDQLNHPTLQRQLRRVLKTLESTPLRRFGVSLIIAARKAG